VLYLCPGITEEQAERDLSIPFQLERCRYHSQGKGWEIVKEFVDAGESARTDKRPDFQKMIVAASNKEFDVILVHKFDRFARNDYDFIVYEKELEDLGIIVESVSEPGDASTPAGYIGRRMMQVISTWYSKNLAIEVAKGMQKKVENGGWPKPAPFGYINRHDKNSAWVEVEPEKGKFITQAFREMATGKWTLEEWADHAYSLGHRGKLGNRIPKTTWSNIFHNRFYLGETWLKKGDIPVKGSHEPLIDEATFVQVQQILAEHDKHRQRVRRHKYLLKGLVYSIDAEASGDGELTRVEARLAKLQRVERNLQRLVIEEEISSDDFKEHRTRIEAEKARLKNTVEAIKQRQHLVKADFEIALQLANELDFLFDKGNFDERRLLCETVFKRIYVDDGRINKVELNSPFSLIATKAKGSGTVLSGGPVWTRTTGVNRFEV